jgi:hypothetical protein
MHIGQRESLPQHLFLPFSENLTWTLVERRLALQEGVNTRYFGLALACKFSVLEMRD